LRNHLNISGRLSSIFALTILFFAAGSVANAQSATQDNSTLNGAKDSVAALDAPPLDAAPVEESSSLRDPQQPAKNRKPPDQCGVTSAKQCVKDFLNDQKAMWTSPLHIKPKDAEWLLPIAAATAVSINFDAQENMTLGVSHSRDVISRRLTDIGSPYALVGFAATAYLIGHFTHNENARETGVLSAEALADTALITEVLKYATNRQRPFEGNGRGDFYPDGFNNYPAGLSFPSGHAASAFAVAKIISDETRGHTWLHLGLYALAATIGAARITGHEHFPSDVLVGGTFGYLIGGYIYHHRASDPTRRSEHGLLLGMAPISDASTHTYGMTIVTNGEIFHTEFFQHFHLGQKPPQESSEKLP
jgi:membrane-associated phospholipid phosphatase